MENNVANQQFELPTNAYASFDALTLKQLMQQRLNDTGIFTDQIFEGSNFNALLDVIAYSYNTLLFYLNRTGSEALFSQSQIYENMNKIVKLLNYNPIGNQTSIVNVSVSGTSDLPIGIYTIPRFSYISVNDIYFSVPQDITFSKSTSGNETIVALSDNVLLYQGEFIEYPIYTATGDDFEQYSLALFDENNQNLPIDHSNIFVFVRESDNKWKEWSRVDNLFLHDGTKNVFECRLNENLRYTIKFGNSINGKKLKQGNLVVAYYLKSDKTIGEISADVLINSSLTLYNSRLYSEIMADVRNTDTNLLDFFGAQSLIFNNNNASTKYTDLEDVNSIRSNSSNIFKTQYRLVTVEDYISFIKYKFNNIIQDVKVVNNFTYLDGHLRYLYNLGLKSPNTDSRVLYNQVTFADSCNFNNIYIYCIPKVRPVNSLTEFNNFLPQGIKDSLIAELQDYKNITAEPVLMDPVYMALSIGTASNIDINNKTLNYESISKDSYLLVQRTKDNLISAPSIKEKISNIFKSYFSLNNATLGFYISIDSIVSDILAIEGIENIYTVNGDITTNGLSLLLWNPVYSNEKEDISIVTQNIQLPYYKVPYYFNIDNIENHINIVLSSQIGEGTLEY